MTIYTRRGDEGRTEIRTGERISKASPRIASYGSVDELNALTGMIRPTGQHDIDDILEGIQQDLHVVQAQLANPDPGPEDPRIADGSVDQLEAHIDALEEELDPLTSFILPGGAENGSRLHYARTVCRRVEREIIALDDTRELDPVLLAYINRLSDLFFVLARVANRRDGVPEDTPTY